MMVILASGSPRRKEILDSHGIHAKIIKPDMDEHIPQAFSDLLTVEQTVMYLALKKGLSVYQQMSTIDKSKSPKIISADTVVYDGTIIGKPETKGEAINTLTSLKGKSHQVLTGVAILDSSNGQGEILYDISTVTFKDYSLEEIEDYIENDQPFDKAGSYAIQSSWKKQVQSLDGDIENVIGLPWYRIEPLI